MNNIRIITILMISAVIWLTGCATLSGGTTETITINSVPSGATVTVDGGATYTTPTSVDLSRKKDHIITVEKAGYKKKTLSLGRDFRGLSTVGGNILWLLPGVIVDAASGGMYEFKEKSVTVSLEPEESGESSSATTE